MQTQFDQTIKCVIKLTAYVPSIRTQNASKVYLNNKSSKQTLCVSSMNNNDDDNNFGKVFMKNADGSFEPVTLTSDTGS